MLGNNGGGLGAGGEDETEGEDSEGEEQEGDYTVYECPGLAAVSLQFVEAKLLYNYLCLFVCPSVCQI